jgi:hypothetical protein
MTRLAPHRAAARVAALALLACLPRMAQAQQFRFADLPWGMAADSVRPRVEALGYRHVRTYENGDLRFRSDGDVVVMAGVAAGKVVSYLAFHPLTDGAIEARFNAVIDSLTKVYGAPGGTRPLAALWQRGFTYLEVFTDTAQGEQPAGVSLWFRGPEGFAEMMRRGGSEDSYAPLDSAWVILGRDERMRFAVEAASISRRPDGSYRARIRMDHATVQEDPTGRYDAIIYGFDFDCARRRLQMRSRTALFRGRQIRSENGATVWTPVRNGTPQAELVSVVCEHVKRS